MPVVTQEVTTREVKTMVVGTDADGKPVQIGDEVVLKLQVTGIRPIVDPETGAHVREDLELGFVKDNGYVLHFCVTDSRMVRKA
jgi:hypothetical protein